MVSTLERKTAALEALLAGYGSLLVAFSGGVDSSLLLAMARKVLSRRVLAVTYASPLFPEEEITGACQTVRTMGVRHRLVTADALAPPALADNGPERCYVCKRHLCGLLVAIAAEEGMAVVAHGANVDDLADFRPGFRAVREAGVAAPLIRAGFTKEDVRTLSRRMGLDTWNKPAQACLASRVPYGTPLTVTVLGMVARAEKAVMEAGMTACRVRYHGDVARIEVPAEEIPRLLAPSVAQGVVRALRQIGFLHVAVDLEGYAPGRMNRALTEEEVAHAISRQ